MRLKKLLIYQILIMFTILVTFTVKSQSPTFDSYISIGDSICSDDTLSPFNGEIVYGLGLTADIELFSDTSYIRIIVSNGNGEDFIVFETYTMIDTIWDFSITQESYETAFLDSYQPQELVIQVSDASIHLYQIDMATQYVSDATALQVQAKRSKDLERINKMNEYIQNNNLKWAAGETYYTSLNYNQKKDLLGSNYRPTGFEYYVGGFFAPFYATSYIHVDPTYDVVQAFDWRDRHDVHDPNSDYHDGDTQYLSGWMTKIGCQSGCWVEDDNEMICPYGPWWNWHIECAENLNGVYRPTNHCVTVASLGALEGLINIYYNNHLDYDLSEQQFAGTGSTECKNYINGTHVYLALDFLISDGVVLEECFPWEGEALECELCSSGSTQRTHIQSRTRVSSIPGTEELKRDLIENGPQIWTTTNSWFGFENHALVLVGYSVIHEGDEIYSGNVIPPGDEAIGLTYWIFRNSHGYRNDFQNGYVYLLLTHDPRYIDKIFDPYSWDLDPDEDRLCRDEDLDGYYNWGIGSKPDGFGAGIPDEMDGNDNDPSIGTLDANGFTTIINDYNMSFENGFGSWRQSGADDVDLKIHSGYFLNHGWAGPSGAQDGDKYLYFKGDEGVSYNISGILESPYIDFDKGCIYSLNFHYAISQISQGDGREMKVQASSDDGLTWSTIWEAPLNGIHGWQEVSLTILPEVNRVRFYTKSSTYGFADKSDMGIDNISIIPDQDDIIITGNEVWGNPDYYVCNNIIIEPNASLKITNGSTVHMNEDAHIFVKQSGELEIDNGTVTSSGDYLWGGIEVWGSTDDHQYTINGVCAQGILKLSDATIENAFNAVTLWKQHDWTTRGGIIKANNSTFINNRRSVEFMSYQNYHPVHEIPTNNLSYFNGCEFDVDDNYLCECDFAYHITMWEVKGINIKASVFKNSMTTEANTGYGIFTMDAGYRVQSTCSSNIYPCPEVDIEHSQFIGLHAGIGAMNSGSIYPLYVDDAEFFDNGFGIQLEGSDLATLINNEIYIGNDVTDAVDCAFDFGVGIDLFNCNGYAVENNWFYEYSTMTGNSIGVRVENTDPLNVQSNEIYLNRYHELDIGNEALGLNYDDDEKIGLQFLCNRNYDNIYDFYIKEGGILENQGSLDLAAGNMFSLNGNNPYSDYNNQANKSIIYYYDVAEPSEYPENHSSKVDPTSVTNSNDCLSSFGGGNYTQVDGLGLTTDQKSAYRQDFMYYQGLYNETLSLYENLKDGGNTEGVVIDIETSWPDEMMALRADLLANSPHLSMRVLYAVADNTEVFPDAVIFEIIAANPDATRDEEFLTYLEEKDDPLPENYIDILRGLAGNISYKTILQSQLADYSNIKTKAANIIVRNMLNDSIVDMDTLRMWFSNIGSISSEYMVIDSYLQEDNTTDALSTLNSIPSLYDLSSEELVEYNIYHSLKSIQMNLISDDRNIFMLDSLEQESLREIAESSNGIAGTQARSILKFVYGDHFCSCPAIPDTSTHKDYDAAGSFVNTEANAVLHVFPNPADHWVAFEYQVPGNEESINILIYNSTGQIEHTLSMSGNTGQLIWDVQNVEPGVYYYEFVHIQGKESGKIIVQ
ncbi:MAG: T9SS type A sorting domain-containing protein [Bacteroidales bacterium]|nr:T9SS type A sorting domain-containing protein [Bacteroidales bacterium]